MIGSEDLFVGLVQFVVVYYVVLLLIVLEQEIVVDFMVMCYLVMVFIFEWCVVCYFYNCVYIMWYNLVVWEVFGQMVDLLWQDVCDCLFFDI